MMESQVLGLTLQSIGHQLRLYNPATDQVLPTLEEASAAHRRAEEARRQEAAARLAELEAELARLRHS